MADPRQTVVFRWLAAGDAGNLDAFDDLLHVDALIHAPAGLSTTSAEAEKAVWKDALAAIPDLQHQVQEVVVDGDIEMARVVVTGTMTAGFGGVGATGQRFQIDQAVILHLREGKVAEARSGSDSPSPRGQGGRGVGDRRHRRAARPSRTLNGPSPNAGRGHPVHTDR
jgi:predicted ester cyclase